MAGRVMVRLVVLVLGRMVVRRVVALRPVSKVHGLRYKGSLDDVVALQSLIQETQPKGLVERDSPAGVALGSV